MRQNDIILLKVLLRRIRLCYGLLSVEFEPTASASDYPGIALAGQMHKRRVLLHDLSDQNQLSSGLQEGPQARGNAGVQDTPG